MSTSFTSNRVNRTRSPVLLTHGWPGSFLEYVKVIEPLTNPTAHGGRSSDAFDVVIPSMPGYGFSSIPHTPVRNPGWDANGAPREETGWGCDRIARAWAVLMERLGYKHYVSAGGDWGSVITDRLAKQAPAGLIGIYVDMPAIIPADIARHLQCGDPPPAGLSADERTCYEQMNALYTSGAGYAGIMVTRPQTLGYSFADTPVGMAAWYYDKFADWTYTNGHPERELSKDDMLNDITLYWLTNTGTSSSRLYWENNANNFNAVDISVPAAMTIFPGQIYQAPRSWAERAYHKLVYYNRVDIGGHFAAWEQPALYSVELRNGTRPMRQRTS